jgi:tetratricopeptide (TPR) repeat protein
MVYAKTTLNAPNGPNELLRQHDAPQQAVLIKSIVDAEYKVLRRIPELQERITPEWQEGIIKKCESHICRLKDAVSKEFLPNVQTPDAETLARAVRNADESALFHCMSEAFQKDPGASFMEDTPFVSLAVESDTFNCYSSAVLFAAALEQMGKKVSVLFNLKHVMLAGDTCNFDTTADPINAISPLQIGPSHQKMQKSDVSALLSVAYTNIGVAFFELGRYGEAFECFDKVLKRDPGFTSALYNAGVAFLTLGMLEDAHRCFDKVLKSDLEFANALYSTGVAFNRRHMPKSARICFDTALRIHPEFVRALYNEGVELNKQDMPKAAINCFNKVLEIYPESAGALYNKGMAFLRLSMPEDALKCFERAYEIRPSEEYMNSLNIVRSWMRKQ